MKSDAYCPNAFVSSSWCLYLKKGILESGKTNGGENQFDSILDACLGNQSSSHAQYCHVVHLKLECSVCGRYPWLQNSLGPSGADRTRVGPMLAPWILLSGILLCTKLTVEKINSIPSWMHVWGINPLLMPIIVMSCTWNLSALSVEGIPDCKIHGAHLGPIGLGWVPCWPHESCYLGYYCAQWYNVSRTWLLGGLNVKGKARIIVNIKHHLSAPGPAWKVHN